MEELRIKGTVYLTPFNRSERTIYEDFKRTEAWNGDPQKGEAYVFVSHQANQLLWIIHAGELGDGTAVLTSRRMRLDREASWDRLQDYANQLGFRLNAKFKTIRQIVEEHRRALHGEE
jgi:hypothetical protein